LSIFIIIIKKNTSISLNDNILLSNDKDDVKIKNIDFVKDNNLFSNSYIIDNIVIINNK
jgi:hypothetical protein